LGSQTCELRRLSAARKDHLSVIDVNRAARVNKDLSQLLMITTILRQSNS